MHNRISVHLSCLLMLAACLTNTSISAQPVQKENIVFISGENILKGQMLIPSERDEQERIPFLVFVGGQEAFESYATDYRSFLQENLEDNLTEENIGLFYVDTRGIHESEGKWQRADFYDRAEDIRAALEYLRGRREVNLDKIALIAHGQASYIAQILAADSSLNLAGMISLAGSVLPVRDALENEYYGEYTCKDMDPSKAMDKAERKAKSSQGWVNTFPIFKRWRQMSIISDFDPTNHLKNIDIPVLFMFGEHDNLVYKEWSENYLKEIFDSQIPSNFDLIEIPAVNHYFQNATPCFEGDRENLDFSPTFQNELKNWVLENL